MKRCATWIVVLLMLLTLTACGAKNDSAGTNDPSQSGNGEPQGTLQLSAYQVTQDQWDAILASAFDNFTCDASAINGQIYMMSPAEGLYSRKSMESGSTYYYIHKGDKVDYYFVNGDRVELFTDESWESHGRNATGGFDFSSDWLDWLPGIYNLPEFQYSEDSRAYAFYNSSEYFQFYFENGKLLRMVYADERGEREYSQFGTTEITLPAAN